MMLMMMIFVYLHYNVNEHSRLDERRMELFKHDHHEITCLTLTQATVIT